MIACGHRYRDFSSMSASGFRRGGPLQFGSKYKAAGSDCKSAQGTHRIEIYASAFAYRNNFRRVIGVSTELLRRRGPCRASFSRESSRIALFVRDDKSNRAPRDSVSIKIRRIAPTKIQAIINERRRRVHLLRYFYYFFFFRLKLQPQWKKKGSYLRNAVANVTGR